MQESDHTNQRDPAFAAAERGRGTQFQGWVILCLLSALILILLQPAQLYQGDAVSIRYSTLRLINEGRLDVDPSVAAKFGERGQYFFENESTGLWYPKYGVLNTLLYVPPLLLEYYVEGPLIGALSMNPAQLRERVFYLNLYQILISLAVASYLYFIALHFNPSAKAAIFYVLACLFGTFTWSYLRAQTVELFQILFFLGLFYSLIRYQHTRQHGLDRNASLHFWLILLYTGLLALGKLVFVLLIPPVILWMIWTDLPEGNSQQTPFRQRLLSALQQDLPRICVFLAVFVGLVCWTNWFRFGSPLTTGYAQWEKETHFFSGHILQGMYGFLFDYQKSIFLTFPLLIFALFHLRGFLKRFPFEYSFVLTVFGLFYLTNSCFINWRGDLCYGPRYLLFVLPALSLPVLGLFPQPATFLKSILKYVMVLTLLVSVFCELLVIAFPFSAPFDAMFYFKPAQNAKIDTYFKSPFWQINFDLMQHSRGRQVFPPLQILRPGLSPESFQKHAAAVKSFSGLNLYFLNAVPKRDTTENRNPGESKK